METTRKIAIHDFEIFAHVGVTLEEQQEAQRLVFDVEIWPTLRFEAMEDALERTVDYDAVSKRMTALVCEVPRCLIETLADEVGQMILQEFSAQRVWVRVRKFIFPHAGFVSVECEQVKEAGVRELAS